MDFLAHSCVVWLTTGPSLSVQRIMLLDLRLILFTFVSPDDQDDDADSTSLELNDNLVFLWSSALGGAQWPRRVVTAPAHSACTGHVPLAAWPSVTLYTDPARHKLYASQVTWSQQHRTIG